MIRPVEVRGNARPSARPQGSSPIATTSAWAVVQLIAVELDADPDINQCKIGSRHEITRHRPDLELANKTDKIGVESICSVTRSASSQAPVLVDPPDPAPRSAHMSPDGPGRATRCSVSSIHPFEQPRPIASSSARSTRSSGTTAPRSHTVRRGW